MKSRRVRDRCALYAAICDSSRVIHTIVRRSASGTRSAIRPVEQLDGVHDRDRASPARSASCSRYCRSRSRRRRCVSMFATLRSRSARGDLRLQDVVGAGRAAAQMRLSGTSRTVKPQLRQQVLGLPRDFLAVLERAGGVVGDRRARARRAGAPRSSARRYSVMSSASAETRAAFAGIGRIVAQHEAVVLDGRAAARRRDQDCVEPLAFDLARPGIDVGARLRERLRARGPCDGRARRSSPRPPASTTSMPCRVSSADRRLVDRRARAPAWRSRAAARRGPCARPAAGKTPAAHRRRFGRRAGVRPSIAPAPSRSIGRPSRPHGRAPAAPAAAEAACASRRTSRRKRRAEAAADRAARAASSARSSRSGQRPPIGLLDMRARMIDEVHVVHARRAGGHAGEAGEAAVDVLDDLGGRRPVVLQHVLDQVDAAARGIELVAEQHIGRAGRGAEAAMHAGAQDLVGLRDVCGSASCARVKEVCMLRPPAAHPARD